MPWLQLHLTIAKEKTSLLELLLQNLGALSVTLQDAAETPILEPMPGEIPLWQQVKLTGLFPISANKALLSIAIEQILESDDTYNIVFEELKDQVWEKTWMKEIKPMRFGQRLLICPQGYLPLETNRTVVKIEPGLAFGTGTHATTKLCLCWLDATNLEGKRIIDFGCGSGILAIAALLLGADTVTAVDHDPQALQATVDNAKKNGISDRLIVCSNAEIPEYKVDILLANLLTSTLLELEGNFATYTQKRGTVILSGILSKQVDEVTSVYSRDFDMQPPVVLDEWSLLIGTRR